MKEIDFTLGLKILIYCLLTASGEFLLQETHKFLLEETFWLKYAIISTTWASVVSLNHLLFPWESLQLLMVKS